MTDQGRTEPRGSLFAELIWLAGGLGLFALLYERTLSAGLSCEDLGEILAARDPGARCGPLWAEVLHLLDRDAFGPSVARLSVLAVHALGCLGTWAAMRSTRAFAAAAGMTFVLLLLAPGMVEVFGSVTSGWKVLAFACAAGLCLGVRVALRRRPAQRRGPAIFLLAVGLGGAVLWLLRGGCGRGEDQTLFPASLWGGGGITGALVLPLIASLVLTARHGISLVLFATVALVSALSVQDRIGVFLARDRHVRVAAASLPQLPATLPGQKVLRLDCPVEMRVLFRRRFGESGEAKVEDLSLLLDGGSPLLPRGLELDVARQVVEFDGERFRVTTVSELLLRPAPAELWFVRDVRQWPAALSPLHAVLTSSRATSFAKEPGRLRPGGNPAGARAQIRRVLQEARDSRSGPMIEIEVEAEQVVLLAVPVLPPQAALRELGADRFGWSDPAPIAASDETGAEAAGIRQVGWVDGCVAVFRCEPGRRSFRIRLP